MISSGDLEHLVEVEKRKQKQIRKSSLEIERKAEKNSSMLPKWKFRQAIFIEYRCRFKMKIVLLKKKNRQYDFGWIARNAKICFASSIELGDLGWYQLYDGVRRVKKSI